MPPKPDEKKQRSRSVFRTVMLPLLLLVVVQILFLAGSLSLSGVIHRLDQNARDILEQQVQNRKNYIESAMVGNWSDLTLLAEEINAAAQRMLDAGTISLDQLDRDSDACAPLLLEVSDRLISTLYAKRLSGIFVVFNTRDLSQVWEGGGMDNKTGIYIRDLDPASPPSSRNADLLLERAPISVVRALHISTDAGWYPLFQFEKQEEAQAYSFFSRSFQAAYATAGAGNDPSDYGYWSKAAFSLYGSEKSAVSYSIPLILPDGTVYGVLGVDLLTDYLCSMMPFDELFDDGQGSYVLGVSQDGGQTYSITLIHGTVQAELEAGAQITLAEDESGNRLFHGGENVYYASVQPMALYNSNAPFEEERWALIGVVPEEKLYGFSSQVKGYLYIAMMCTLIAGVVGSLIVSRRISRPIRSLSREVERAQQSRGGIPKLSATGIAEIDSFSQAIAALSREVVDASTKFLRIMEMASVEIGGFELRRDGGVFVTENFFALFGYENVETKSMTEAEFRRRLQALYDGTEHTEVGVGNTLFHIRTAQGGVRYLRVEVTEDADRYVGLVEDVTQTTEERLCIEHERDYDLLTGLYNRRAFYRQAEALFQSPERLGHAAMVMLDLDNLKITNDRFGHDYGDQYIRQAGQCFSAAVPSGTLCARVSGDEFLLLFYGYDSRARIRGALEFLRSVIRGSDFKLPNGEHTCISASGGVAWYPEDSQDFNELMKFADFAMYQMKQNQKGGMGDFDLGVYNQESYLTQSRREFQHLLDEELVSYHFQPIVDSRTGRPAAYEALMRLELPTLKSPESVLQLARKEGRLQDVERMTWFKSGEAYQVLLDRGLVEGEALLFINSIASQRMQEEDERLWTEQFPALVPRMVIEITEAEDMDLEATRAKRNAPGVPGLFALDDYGSGYNSERNLLALAPKFVKVDISIIRGIDSDTDKQQIVDNIVRYAHQRDMLIVAEGLETAQELTKVLELGVDLLQGYYLARPGAVPPQVSQSALEVIRRFQEQRPTLVE